MTLFRTISGRMAIHTVIAKQSWYNEPYSGHSDAGWYHPVKIGFMEKASARRN